MKQEIVVGSRESRLAMWQANWVVERLRELCPEYSYRIVGIRTQGDNILDVALAKIGDKGLFTKELELAMLRGEIDLAVHSMKDLPTELPEGLTIGAICLREYPGDVLISREGRKLEELPRGAVIGTSSLRRRAASMSGPITSLLVISKPWVSGCSSPMPRAPPAAQRSTSWTAASPHDGSTEQKGTSLSGDRWAASRR